MNSKAKVVLTSSCLCCIVCAQPCCASSEGTDRTLVAAIGRGSFEQAVPFNPSTESRQPVMQFDLWMPVPNWLGGTWQASSEVVLYSYNYREQRNVVDEPMTLPINRISTIGAQRDSSGQIWHYTGAPYIRSIDTPNYIEHQQIDRLVLLNTSAHLVTTRCLATVTHVDRSTDETLDKFIEQTTTTYEPLSEGVLQVTFLVNDFDMHDRPRNSSKSVCTETRVKPFQPVDQDERGNLRYLFNQFEKLNRYFTK